MPAREEGVETAGSVTRIEFKRSPLTVPLDRAHEYDLLFWRQYRKLESLVRNFRPHLVQITGPSDVGMLGTLIARRLQIPLAASWQTNLHQYARSRAAAALSFLPKSISPGILNGIEQTELSSHAGASTNSRNFCLPRIRKSCSRWSPQRASRVS